MLEDALKTEHRLIGMVQPVDDEGDVLHKIGCAGRVTQFAETPDGRYAITLTGVSRFEVGHDTTGFSPYRRCDVDWQKFSGDLAAPDLSDMDFDRENFLGLLSRYFDAMSLSTDWDSLKDADDELLINSLAMLCPFDPEERQALLEAATLADRQAILNTLFKFALHSGAGHSGTGGDVFQ
jgi:Lon protease-like protein